MHPYCIAPVRGKHGRRDIRSVADRFWPKVNRDGPIPPHRPELGPCWVWTASCHYFGYGWLSIGSEHDGTNRMEVAHRISWVLHTGADVPDGLYVLHHCDNPPCVRFGHLWLGTNADNLADMARKGRAGGVVHPERMARGDRSGARIHRDRMPRGERNGQSKLTDVAVIEMRRMRAEGMTLKAIGDHFGVSLSTVHLVAVGKIWTHVV